jgi:hypothetical protein
MGAHTHIVFLPGRYVISFMDVGGAKLEGDLTFIGLFDIYVVEGFRLHRYG